GDVRLARLGLRLRRAAAIDRRRARRARARLRRAGRVLRVHAGLVRAEPGVALLEERGRLRIGPVAVAGLEVRARRAEDEQAAQHVADGVERVDGERLPVDVVPERLE